MTGRQPSHTPEPEAPSHEPGAIESRALAAESGERRRLSRDLHDGTQQRLVVLSIGLSELIDAIDSDPAHAKVLATRLENETQEAISELRALVDGLQPPVLTDRGLVPALHNISRLLPLPVSMVTQGVGRYDSTVEDAVFFTCREALQNVMKHAPDATIVWVMLIDHGDRLEFSVEDNGPGFDAALPGGGSATMHHRVESLGGSLTISSTPGVGTRVEGRISARPTTAAPS
ncbi:MAG TPA: sensor histidine kinase [Solirubrobacteraceae bacterium]|nr:sensor histidine kinase [Solirubrobacteraceae bacterium]